MARCLQGVATMLNTKIATALFILGCGAGCGDNNAQMTPDAGLGYGSCVPIAPAAVDPSGGDYIYLVNQVQFGKTVAEADSFAFNLDGDPHNVPDDAVGHVLAGLFGSYLDNDIQALINSGGLLEVFDVQATDLASASGVDVSTAPATRSAAGDLVIDPGDEGHTTGEIENGVLFANIGTASIAVAFPGLTNPFVIHLEAARVEATIDGNQISGKLSGIISPEDVENDLDPAVITGFNAEIASDCPGGVCVEGSLGEELLKLFDTNMDGTITLNELTSSTLYQEIAQPDVDLFNSQGQFAPGCDGSKDGLSVAVHFTATRVPLTGI